MKNDTIANSVLHVVASENVKAEQDIECSQEHSISDLLNEETQKDEDNKKN